MDSVNFDSHRSKYGSGLSSSGTGFENRMRMEVLPAKTYLSSMVVDKKLLNWAIGSLDILFGLYCCDDSSD